MMTSPDEFLSALPLKQAFHDRHEQRSYLRAIETARRVLDDSSLLANGATHLDRFMSNDPRQATYVARWRMVLAGGAEMVARRLLSDDEDGRALRASSPVFVRFTPDELAALWSSTPAR